MTPTNTEFCQSGDGLVHFVSTSNPEYTLCGDAFDSDDVTPGAEWGPTKKRVVTCELCATQIRACRGVKIKTN